MSIKSLLDELSAAQVLQGKIVREPSMTAASVARSMGSPSSPENTRNLNYDLVLITSGLPITTQDELSKLAPTDIQYIKDWHKSNLSTEPLTGLARSLAQRKEMNQGNVPSHYTNQAICNQCGPVWLWFSGEVSGCPWCWNRVAGRATPRP